MRIELAIAGIGCLALAAGHAAVGRRVLPALKRDRLPSTPFGPPSMTLGMVRFTWRVVTTMLLTFGGIFLTLAAANPANPQSLFLRWFGAMFLVATGTGVWQARRRPLSLLRLPVPFVCLAIGLLCWTASV